MQFRTILFDLDGTLIDHFRAIHRCHAHAMRSLGRPEPTMHQVRAAVGGGFENAILKIAGPEHAMAATALYRRHWDETMLDDVELLPGAVDILTVLRDRGIGSAVLTNKRGDSSRLVCERLGLSTLLDGVFGAEDTAWLKPAREFTMHVLSALGADARTTLMIGDSPYDVATAKNAALEFVGVTTGTHTAEELRNAGAAKIFTGLPEVARHLGLRR